MAPVTVDTQGAQIHHKHIRLSAAVDKNSNKHTSEGTQLKGKEMDQGGWYVCTYMVRAWMKRRDESGRGREGRLIEGIEAHFESFPPKGTTR